MRTPAFILAALLAPAVLRAQVEPQPTPAPSPTPAPASAPILTLGLGARALSLEGDRPARFEEYRDVPRGGFLESLRLEWGNAGPWFVSLAARDVRERDESYTAVVAHPGRLRVRAAYDRTPQRLADDATWLLRGRDGRPTFDDAFRQILEDASFPPPGVDPTLAQIMPRVLETTADLVDLRTQRSTGTGEIRLGLAPGWDLTAFGRGQERRGRSWLGTGTYIRRQAVPGDPESGVGFFDRERFEPRGLELIRPINTRTAEAGLVTSFRRQTVFLTAGVEGSRFENRENTLVWDNPFEAAPSVASASDRGRFARGGLALAPDNTFGRAFLSGGARLPGRTVIRISAALGQAEQDEPFMPFTQNEALTFPGPDAMVGTADDIPGTTLSLLPARSLDGEVRTLRTDLTVSSRPVDRLTLRAGFRRYDLEDNRPELHFPGYAGFGESFFRRGIGQREGGQEVLVNEVGGFTRTVLSAGAGWRLADPVTLDLEYRNIVWDYEARQVDETDEDELAASLRFTPLPWLSARLSWLDASRDFTGPYEVGLETSGVRQFDIWKRDRTRAAIELDAEAGERWVLALSYSDWQDEYPGTIEGFDFPYGFQEYATRSLAASATYAAERWSLSAAAGTDRGELESLHVTKTSIGPDTIQYDPTNRWLRTQDDTTDWASLTLDARLSERVRMAADLGYSMYDGELDTENLAAPNVNSAVAYDWPDFATELLTARLSLTWRLSRWAAFEARYWYEPFRLDDFMWEVVEPYMQGTVLETGDSPSDLRAQSVSRLLWLDANYSDYDANVFSALVHLSF